MGFAMADDLSDLDDLLDRARAGEMTALDAIFSRHQDRLRQMVQLRLDRRLQGRIDPSDVLQEAFVDAVRHLPDYLAAPRAPLFLWLRYLVGMRLKALHRHHLGVKQRNAKREISIYQGPLPSADSAALAARLLGNMTSPSEAAVRAERVLRLQDALNAMDPLDREILSLRHFENLSRSEAAQELGIAEGAAGKRYLRALQRLRQLLDDTNARNGS
jgi:RNA polymerase sigma-70 factor (ECF subfamily)